jgi:hypothetical protein
LSDEQRATRKERVQQILACYQQEGKEFLKHTVEMWIHEFEPELKSQSA